MADFGNIISKIQLVKVQSRKLTIVVLIIAIALSMGALAALHISMAYLQNRTEDLRQKAALLEADNSELVEDIEQVGSIQAIVEIAENELGLVQPDTVFYKPESD